MATEIIMPKLGLTMEQGTIGAWLVEEGQNVDKGQPLLEVITDKVTMEVEAQAGGVLRKIIVPAGKEVAVSTPVGVIADEGEDISKWLEAAPAAPSPTPSPEATTAEPAQKSQPLQAVPTSGRQPHRASPKARKMAAARGVDLAQLEGSGPGGRIVSSDIEKHLAAAPTAPTVAAAPMAPAVPVSTEPGVEQLVPLTRAQQVTAERLTASYQQSPHINIAMDVSAIWLQQFRQGYKRQGKKVSFNDFIVKACGKALSEFPRFNSYLEEGGVRLLSEVNIGIAVDTPQGLLVPVLRQVPQLSIEEIAAGSAGLVDRARTGGLGIDEMQGGTFTISNLGMFGVSYFTAIINPPQVAILAVGAIENRVVARDDGALAAEPRFTLNLAADHRVLDGAVVARFLVRVKEILETPGLLA